MALPLQFATQLAQETGELLKTYFHTKGIQARLKADHSVVTEADIAANTLITDSIRSAYPDHEIISEEGATLSKNNDHSVWVIDPLDGSTNFSLGLHTWGVSIARLVGGVPDTAAICFPLLGEMYTSQRGQGAFLNDEPISEKSFDKDQPIRFLAMSSYSPQKHQIDLKKYKLRIIGSACYDLCLVACGAASVGFLAKPKIWDLASGWLIVKEAGRVIEPYHDAKPFPISPGIDYEVEDYPTLMAADRDLMKAARAGITPK